MILFRLARYYSKVRRQRSLGVLLALALVVISILGNSVCFYLFDGKPQGLGFDDALWYSFISITTIGYGDLSAQSFAGRIGTLFFIVAVGLTAFSIVLGMGIDWVSEQTTKGIRGWGSATTANHVIIVNFPSETRVRQIIQELKSDPEFRNMDVVIVSETLDQLPFTAEGTYFVRGPILEEETHRRAGAEHANMVIVLATSYTDSSSDAVVASAVSVLDRIKAELHIVAECLNPKHRMLFDSVNCDAIVYSMQISGNLLAQEVHDPGISQLIDTVTSNQRGTTLFSTLVPENQSVAYQELAKQMLDADINLICVNRDSESFTSFRNISPAAGDRIIYAGRDRLTWDQIWETTRL